ncbi:hypothetical protein L210DRAFT_3415189 [Boletus edulis BED1]|uniref:Uncharacterized protein n=1 Tax=Boletus edulis BED1 TaxID=1328754 RepID=A0AAD4BIT8_BOLED|nr:hypothetical protein L210DRAFT_3430360 [Boletus edulis BED1]KAF8431763.1 hypothetical protein L210DRAFT_3415189 [Boletus edulis BED1]
MVAPSDSRAVAVYCAASIGHQMAFQQAAISIAHALVAANRPLVYGGGNSGIMGVVSGAVANSEGGKVTGIIPYAIHAAGGEKDKGDGHPQSNLIAEMLDEKQRGEIVVNSMHERKVEMARRSGAFIGLPGGFGTFEEILEVITWNQLNIHNKPVVLINVFSYYNPLRDLIRTGIREGFIRPENERLVVFIDGPADHADHETFDWGRAAVDAIDAWEHAKVCTLPFYWNKDEDTSDMTHVDAHVHRKGNANIPSEKAKVEHIETIPGLSTLPGLKLTHSWFKRVWHVRSRSGRV